MMLRKLCKDFTNLNDEEIEKLLRIEEMLPVIANLVDADVFIDCITRDPNIAIVVAEAKPTTHASLYKSSVVGQIALREKEPAALRTLEIGMETRDLKAITQENLVVKQNVVPIKNELNQVIGVLIVEQDVTNSINQNKNMEILSETAEQLTETLLNLKDENEHSITRYLNDAIIMIDANGKATYANPAAEELYRKLGYIDKIVGMDFDNLVLDGMIFEKIKAEQNCISSEVAVGKLSLNVKYAVTIKNENIEGIVILMKDITDIKEKEKELILKSVVIREIHHRVKNNLQTIASLLRLQSRRMDNDDVKRYFNESISRILSIAGIHEILAQNGVDEVDILTILYKLKDSTLNFGISNKNINLEIKGDSFIVDSDKATSIALVVNELIQNAFKHAFSNKSEGKIEVIIQKGIMYSNISIIDDGKGFDTKAVRNESLGLNIVRGLVKDQLHGNLNIESDNNGTKIVFDFQN
jgi:two-component system, sensor histidine kinase PdtaS